MFFKLLQSQEGVGVKQSGFEFLVYSESQFFNLYIKAENSAHFLGL